jgi:DNA modification methylase
VPHRALFIWLPTDRSQIELVLGATATVLAQADEPIDLIVADPPWALGRAERTSAYQRTYVRNHHQVVGGYVEVDPAEYAAFAAEWVAAAGAALRPGGYLAVVTGGQQAARVQPPTRREAASAGRVSGLPEAQRTQPDSFRR